MPNHNTYSIENTQFAYRSNLGGDPTRSKYADDRRLATFIVPDKMVNDFVQNGVRVKQTRPGRNHPNPEEFEYHRNPTDPPSLYIRVMYVEQDMDAEIYDYDYDPFASEYQ